MSPYSSCSCSFSSYSSCASCWGDAVQKKHNSLSTLATIAEFGDNLLRRFKSDRDIFKMTVMT